MNPLGLYNRLSASLTTAAPEVLPLAARLVFAGVLCGYFWASAMTKLDPGFLNLSDGAFVQIFPRAMEAAGYDSSALGLWPRLVVLGGTIAEFLLPLLIVIGLFTRLAALGMIGFIIVQSATDIIGHGAGAETIGAWFDRAADSLILDQRGLWVFLLLVLVILGAGRLSADRLAARFTNLA